MAVETGVQVLGNYAGAANNGARIDLLISMLPELNNPGSSGSVSGFGNLDEMSPSALVQLKVELYAIKAALT